MKSAMERFLAKTKPADGGCIVWTACCTGKGYGKFAYKYVTYLAHRWIFEQTHGITLTSEQLILHACDNPPCVNVRHLRIGTHRDNAADMDLRGRRNAASMPGTANPRAKLTESDVREIRRLRSEGHTLEDIAGRYPVSFKAVHHIVRRETWKHVA